MKFNVSGKELQTQLSAVSKVINSKNALSILDNFLLEVKGGVLYITGSDQENVVKAELSVTESDEDGAIAMPAKRLLDVVKEVSNQALSFAINDDTKEIDMTFLNGHFNFMGIDSKEYPRPSMMEPDSTTFILSAKTILSGIDNTLFAAATDTIRPIMTGIYWDIHQEDITFATTDTHKLVRFIDRNCDPATETSFCMPPKPANILKSILSKDEDSVIVTIDSKSATFKFGTYSLSCRFIKGNFPPYNRVIPTDNPFEMIVDRVTLLNAMRRMALFASMASSLVKFNIQHDEVLLASQDLDYSTSAEERVVCSYSGNPMTIGFNATYMIEILSNLKSEKIKIQLSDPSRPGIFCPETQPENQDILMLLMPMQVVNYDA
ncbi:MAG: DNA polymerase III subunit beta [Prevotella sp.]|nr:DNA polymerase III subunit beta [Bacteroides sp.]MCM1365685.1 DNA polymerase III subunit beta [Prevotella sp.]MCM1437139.1 DNA polymerase III subunit beta [Prevotella sp.]